VDRYIGTLMAAEWLTPPVFAKHKVAPIKMSLPQLELDPLGDQPPPSTLPASEHIVSFVQQETPGQEVDNKIDPIDFGHEGGNTLDDKAARAGIEQLYLIPTTGVEEVTSKWEKWTFMVFRKLSSCSAPRVTELTLQVCRSEVLPSARTGRPRIRLSSTANSHPARFHSEAV
jgi:hypothetical protein